MDDSSSKELLYAEYTGNTVVGHVLERLELQKRIESFKENKKSATFERVKKFITLIEKEKDESNALVGISEQENQETEKSSNGLATENGEIEVVMEVNDNSPNSKVDAWFMLKLPKEQESKCSDDNDDDDSSDTSDDELELNFPVNANGFALNDSSNFSTDKRKVNTSHSSKVIKNSSNFLIDDSSDTSDDQLQQNFPIIANGFMLNNGTNSTNSSSSEEELTPPKFSKIQDSSNFVHDDSSISSDVKSEQRLSFNIIKENINCENSGTLQISLPLKKDKRIFEIPDESSEDFNDDFVKHSSSPPSAKNMFLRKMTMSNFALTDSSNYSLDKCEQNDMFSNEQSLGEDDSESSNVMTDHLNNKTAECLRKIPLDRKRKLCVEDGIPNICDSENIKKKVTGLDRRVEI